MSASYPTPAPAPAHQFMDAATMLELVKENVLLKHEVKQMQTLVTSSEQQRTQVLHALKQLEQRIAKEEESHSSCCADVCVGCTQMCCQTAYRFDHLCTQRFVNPYKEYWNCEKYCLCIAAWTICLPYNILRYAACGTTYVCCNASCSKLCLDITTEPVSK